MNHSAKRIMKAADIRQKEGDRKGTHIFRHHLATTLLGNNVSQVVISNVLGHSSSKSTEVYLSADFKHLKMCALDISCFPLSEGVFGDE
jgi:site-specific recombinase XerD